MLEEFHEEIKKHSIDDPLIIENDYGGKWCVYYKKASKNIRTKLIVPSENAFSVSGDNCGGFIVAVTLSESEYVDDSSYYENDNESDNESDNSTDETTSETYDESETEYTDYTDYNDYTDNDNAYNSYGTESEDNEYSEESEESKSSGGWLSGLLE